MIKEKVIGMAANEKQVLCLTWFEIGIGANLFARFPHGSSACANKFAPTPKNLELGEQLLLMINKHALSRICCRLFNRNKHFAQEIFS